MNYRNNIIHTQEECYWGGIFPIVKLRCTEPRGLRVENSGSVTAASWHSNTDADLFQLSVCQGDTPADNGILLTTTDTTLALPSLVPDSTYSIYLRKQCIYCTSSWADTVWSEWSGPVVVTAHSEGMLAAQQPSISLSPNPASGTFKLEAGTGMTMVEVYSLDGRKVHSQHMPEEAASASIDASNWPSGTYILHILTRNGVAMKRLTVAH